MPDGQPTPATAPAAIAWPALPALVAWHGRAAILTADGELLDHDAATAAAALHQLAGPRGPVLLVHAPATWRRLGLPARPALDLAELFAFVAPARSAPPTPAGLAAFVDLPPPVGLAGAVAALEPIARALLARLAAGRDLPANRHAASLAARMGQAGWGWAPLVLAALRAPTASPAGALAIWTRLPDWEEPPAPTPPASHPVAPAEARARLAALLGPGAEQRPGQSDYAHAAAAAFAPRTSRGDPTLVLAEAGTGTGKTLGYIAPASLWAERNHAPVWISTYTRHLQRQIDTELARLFPDPLERRRRVVVRKGRENYLCLLNFEDIAGNLGAAAPIAIGLGLLARWAGATADGDLFGGDLPGWLADLFGGNTLLSGLADRRGECIHAACPHWRRCFVEHTIRRAKGADLVVANHALVMAQAAWGGIDDVSVPTRYVFDEGHHLFDAADGAFAAELSGREGAELRRWLLGAEGGRSRARGLARRLDDLVADRPALRAVLDAALSAARALPPPGWSARITADTVPLDAGAPNPAEQFLRLARRQVLARAPGSSAGLPGGGLASVAGALECDLYPVDPALAEAAAALLRAFTRLAEPLTALMQRLADRLEDDADDLDPAMRQRIEAACRTLKRRAIDRLSAWQAMLRALAEPPPAPGERPEHLLFLRLDRAAAGERDVGLHRHWLDPTIPFAASLAAPAHGLLVTSATLRDAGAGAHDTDIEAAWRAAEARVGAPHLPSPPLRVSVASPFDYAAQTRAFVVTDVAGGDIAALAGAYRALFLAAGGGALGLFTAIARLRAVHARIAPALEAAGLPLLAQHVDAIDNATLVEIFRAEQESCLLGTDAMRDGVDVPGRALRLVVFERVPWPRPDILHRERRVHLGGGDPKGWDERIARLRLRQAFGRLIRGSGDRGVFVLLDRQTPTRLLNAFPEGVEVRRVGLAEAVRATRAFLEPPSSDQGRP